MSTQSGAFANAGCDITQRGEASNHESDLPLFLNTAHYGRPVKG
jgi:hypothetical protein